MLCGAAVRSVMRKLKFIENRQRLSAHSVKQVYASASAAANLHAALKLRFVFKSIGKMCADSLLCRLPADADTATALI